MRPYETLEEAAPEIRVHHAESTYAYRSGKVWKSGGPLGPATQDGAALLTGIAFETAASAERFLAELVERSGITEEATGIPLGLLCSKRHTYRTWGHYKVCKILAGRRTARLVLYRWSVGTLVHEFAHHVEYRTRGEEKGRRTNTTWHSPRFYEILREMHGIAFEILGTTEAAEYEKLQERINVEEATQRALKEKFDESAEQMKKALRRAA